MRLSSFSSPVVVGGPDTARDRWNETGWSKKEAIRQLALWWARFAPQPPSEGRVAIGTLS